MSETNPENPNEVVGKKLESSAEHAKKAIGAASEAGKAVGDTVKKHAQEAYQSGREHLTAAAKDISDAASAKYDEIRGQARAKAETYRAKAENLQSDTESYIRENPLKSIGIAVGVGFVLGVILRR